MSRFFPALEIATAPTAINALRCGRVRMSIVLLLAFVASGCSTVSYYTEEGFESPGGGATVVVMPVDVTVSRLTLGGKIEPSKEWTDQARAAISSAIRSHQLAQNTQVTVLTDAAIEEPKSADLRSMLALHNVVGKSILSGKLGIPSGYRLPSKKERFDWVLGDVAINYGRAFNYDYALFLYAESAFSTVGRKALIAASYAMCGAGVVLCSRWRTRGFI